MYKFYRCYDENNFTEINTLLFLDFTDMFKCDFVIFAAILLLLI